MQARYQLYAPSATVRAQPTAAGAAAACMQGWIGEDCDECAPGFGGYRAWAAATHSCGGGGGGGRGVACARISLPSSLSRAVVTFAS